MRMRNHQLMLGITMDKITMSGWFHLSTRDALCTQVMDIGLTDLLLLN